MSNPKELILHRERKGENIKIERLLNMVKNRTDREGGDEGERWLHWMYVFLPENERKLMHNRIKNSGEKEKAGVTKEKIVKKKGEALKSLEDFSKKMDIDFKEMYGKKTPQERNKILMEDQVSLDVCEKTFERWKERQEKLRISSLTDWFIMSFDEMYPEKLDEWTKNLELKIQAGGSKDEMRPVANAILNNKKEWDEINEILDRESQGERKAKDEQKRIGEAVVFLGNTNDTVKVELKKLFCKKLSKEQIEEDLEMVSAGKEYDERIIKELQREDQRLQIV
jgi:hypothetical protein